MAGKRVPVKSDLFKYVYHFTTSELHDYKSHNCGSTYIVDEIKSLVSKQLLQELVNWKLKVISFLDTDRIEFTDRLIVTTGSMEIRGEAMTTIHSVNGLVLDPSQEYAEIVQAPKIVWHKGE